MSAQNWAYGTQFNPSQIYVDGVYIEVVPPTGYFGGVPTSVAFDEGTASWGYLNSPQLNSNPNGVQQDFGPIAAVALTDIYDLATDARRALNQASQSLGMFLYSNRIQHGSTDLTLSGTPTTGDLVNLNFWSALFIPVNGGLTYNLQYTVLDTDTTPIILAASLAAAVNASTPLINAGFSATSTSATLSVVWPPNGTGTLTPAVNGAVTATVGSSTSPTTDDVITLAFTNQVFPLGVHHLAYTVLNTDTTPTILAASLNTVINADTTLSAAGIASTNHSSPAIILTSGSPFATTYSAAFSVDATETIVFTGAPPSEVFTVVGAPSAPAYVNLYDITTPTPQRGATIVAVNSGVLGEQVSIRLFAGTAPSTVTVTVIPFAGGGAIETYPNLPGAGASFWTALAAALNGGANNSRGPSNFLRVLLPQTTTGTPALNTTMSPQTFLVGGNDGRLGVISADLIGSNAGEFPTGLYTLQPLQFTPSVAWCAGLTDTTVWSTIMSIALANNVFFLLAFPQNTSVATAVSTKSSLSIVSFAIGILKDWVYWYDQANATTRLLPPTATAGGLIATLPPWASPLNVPMSDISGTERNNPITGNYPYQNSDLASLEEAGIMVITNPIPGYPAFGLRNSQNSIGNKQPNSVVEYGRMTFYLVETNSQLLGPFAGKLQGQGTNDPLRAAVRNALNQFYSQLAANNYIVGASVICNTTNNTQATVSQFALFVSEQVTYMTSVLDILATIQGGVNVVYNTNPLGQSTLPLAA